MNFQTYSINLLQCWAILHSSEAMWILFFPRVLSMVWQELSCFSYFYSFSFSCLIGCFFRCHLLCWSAQDYPRKAYNLCLITTAKLQIYFIPKTNHWNTSTLLHMQTLTQSSGSRSRLYHHYQTRSLPNPRSLHLIVEKDALCWIDV